MPAREDAPRLVIDTNIFVSAVISPAGLPARILAAVRERKAVHLVSDPIMEEYLEVLSYPRIRKFRDLTNQSILEIAAYLIFRTERVELATSIRQSPDPDDNVFLETAVDGRADLIVTGDKKDLLSLGNISGIPIVSASEAVARMNLI